MSQKKSSPSKRKSDAFDGVYFKKLKVTPKLKLAEAKLARDRRETDGFVEGEATLRILDVPETFTKDRCPEFFTDDKKKKPCFADPVSLAFLA